MSKTTEQAKLYVLDTNVLIHDPAAILNFEEHHLVIPMVVLEELDKLKSGKSGIAADCREAIRKIDRIIGDASPEAIADGVPIIRTSGEAQGLLSILVDTTESINPTLPEHLNDNKIINSLIQLQKNHPDKEVVLITKDINMRLKARGCGVGAQDYHTDQLLTDIDLLKTGYHVFPGSFWKTQSTVKTFHDEAGTFHQLPITHLPDELSINTFLVDEEGFVGKIVGFENELAIIQDLPAEQLLTQSAWGLTPRDLPQALALHLLLDPEVSLVTLSGQAGSGKTILALAAAIEMTMVNKQYRHIIATRSTQNLDEDIGFLPGTEAEKMEPWLGAITDNLEALHADDENSPSSIDYILQKVPLQFKSLNYIRGRSFQHSFIMIDECQNLTPHQVKTIITRAGTGSKVVCLGNLAQIDTPYLNAISSGLTYLIERMKNFPAGGTVHLQGSPRSALAEYAEKHL